MALDNFYLKLAGALLLSFSSASILTTQTGYRGIISAIAAFSALGLMKSAERSSLHRGRTDRMKVALTSTTTLYELVLLLGAVSLAVIPKYAAAIVLASIAFAEILHLELEQELKENFSADVAREGRVLVLAISLAAYSFNPYFLFYGILFIALLAVYDSLSLITALSREL